MLKDLLLRVLNQTVGEYFENIDSSQLQLSVFSGNIALQDLILKRNACDGLGLPFRIIAGRCANLTLKVPWIGLWTQPVEVDLRDLYLLIVPGSSLPYDEELEERARFRLKLQLLDNIEAAQKELALAASADAQQQGYIEKLTMQIVRNLQIRIEAIHIRYEDGETNPEKNFAVGCVLSNLSILTTNSAWVPRYVSDSGPTATVHKVMSMEGFAIYWNCNSFMISKSDNDIQSRLNQLKEMLKLGKFDNLLGPISITTKVIINSSPEKGANPFTEPKMLLDTVVEEVAIGISNLQFQDMLQLAVSMESLYRKEHYRKYRPHGKPYKGNYRLWWQFAYDCVLEDIQRRRNNWRWMRMLAHRRDCKQYYQAMFKKVIQRKTSAELIQEVEELEMRLDIFNILLIRKQVDLCLRRRDSQVKKLKAEQSWYGWMKSWVLYSDYEVESNLSNDPITPKEMTVEEKRSLLTAIGFTDTDNVATVSTPPPKEYVEAHVDFLLNKLKVVITQDSRHWNPRRSMAEGFKDTILDLQIKGCETSLDSRQEGHGLKISFKLQSIDVYGGDAPEDAEELDSISHIIAPRRDNGVESNLLEVLYEQSPLNSEFGQRLKIHGAPLDITYDANTIMKLVTCFTLPKNVSLQKLQSRALLTYTKLKARSSTKIKSLMKLKENDKFEMDIHLEAPCIIIPQFMEFFSPTINVIVIELGELIVTSQLVGAEESTSNKR